MITIILLLSFFAAAVVDIVAAAVFWEEGLGLVPGSIILLVWLLL